MLSGPAVLNGTSLQLTGTGLVTVRATQPGDATYLAAAAADVSFTVQSDFASWQQAHFSVTDLADPARSEPSAVLAADGLTNLMK